MNKAKLIIVQLSTEHRSHIATLALEIEPGCEAACRECRGRLGRLGMVDIKHDLSTDHCEPSLKRYHPSPRRYHCAEQVEGQLYVWGGLTVTPISLKTVDVFDPHLEKWTQCFTTGSQPKGFSNGASASVDVHRCMYVYGGSDGKGSSYYGALHQLDVVDFIWTQLSPHCHNGPMRKVACGMVSYKRDLIVFGGYGSHSPFSRAPFDTQVGPTNELHVFNLDIGMYQWVLPLQNGLRIVGTTPTEWPKDCVYQWVLPLQNGLRIVCINGSYPYRMDRCLSMGPTPTEWPKDQLCLSMGPRPTIRLGVYQWVTYAQPDMVIRFNIFSSGRWIQCMRCLFKRTPWISEWSCLQKSR